MGIKSRKVTRKKERVRGSNKDSSKGDTNLSKEIGK